MSSPPPIASSLELIFSLDLPKPKVDTLNNVYSEAHMSGMKGSVIIEKLRNPELRREWDKYVYKLAKSIKKLNEAKHSLLQDPTGLEFLEAVLAFTEARDEERNFFWDAFVENRSVSQRQLDARKKAAKSPTT